MRASAFVGGTIVAIGIYLAAAAAFAFSPTWIGLGMVLIAATAGIAMVATAQSTAVPRRA